VRVLCLLDSPVQGGDQWIWHYLPQQRDRVDFEWVTPVDRFARWGKLLSYYPTYLLLALRALRRCRRERYDLVVAWEGKSGFPVALLRQLTGQRRPPLVILTFSVRGPVTRFPWLMRYAMGAVEHVTVPSLAEREFYATALNFPIERISFCPLGAYDLFGADADPATMGEFVFAGGRSGRDYATLFAAVEGTSIPVIVNARSFNLKGLSIPPNVTCDAMLPVKQYGERLKAARVVVVPLRDKPEAIGLSAVLYAMAAGKAIVATRAGGVADYICHGNTGLLVAPGDPSELRAAIEFLWQQPHAAAQLGARARQAFTENFTFPAFARRVYPILQGVVASPQLTAPRLG
jgi:glycosyltransferase involved in cell wall biosynthesis